MKLRIIALAVLLLAHLAIHAKMQRCYDTAVYPLHRIQKINEKIEQALLTKNAGAVTAFYVEALTFFPEYKPAIFDTKSLNAFYEGWLRTVAINSYKKKILQVEELPGHFLEIGTFRLHYSPLPDSAREYKGKYMVLWKQEAQGRLRIVSESFGADTYIAADKVPYAGVRVEETNRISKNEVTDAVYAEVEAFNTNVIKNVESGDGGRRAAGFTQDGIYLPHFDSILVGMDLIRPYMLKTYKPGSLIKVKHTYNRIYDFGDYIFLNGHFKGTWGDSILGGTLEGNMSNLMKRDKNGLLLMHRQIGNNDRKDGPLN